MTLNIASMRTVTFVLIDILISRFFPIYLALFIDLLTLFIYPSTYSFDHVNCMNDNTPRARMTIHENEATRA